MRYAHRSANPKVRGPISLGRTIAQLRPAHEPRGGARNTSAFNTATGVQDLEANQTGKKDTAIGHQTLQGSNGNQNIAIGGAGAALTSGNKNIYLGHPGRATESKVMRLGSGQRTTCIAGVATAAVTGRTVVIGAMERQQRELAELRDLVERLRATGLVMER